MVNYIPVLTTIFSLFFLSRIIPHYLARKSPYLLWWTLGVATFGAGTLTESINAIFGWSEWNTKIWYIVGALLGGYPLAQGTIYLLMNKRFADISAVLCSAVIVIAAICVLLSPIAVPEGFDYRLTGRVFEWQWVRAFSPLLNLYAFVFLFGGAVYSAIQYFAVETAGPASWEHFIADWRVASGHRRHVHALRPMSRSVHHGVHRLGLYLSRLLHDAEGPRLRPCTPTSRPSRFRAGQVSLS
jgi:hypothetical protein